MFYISYNDDTWHSFTLPKEDPKNINKSLDTPLGFSAGIAFFHWKSPNFAVPWKIGIDCIRTHNF